MPRGIFPSGNKGIFKKGISGSPNTQFQKGSSGFNRNPRRNLKEK